MTTTEMESVPDQSQTTLSDCAMTQITMTRKVTFSAAHFLDINSTKIRQIQTNSIFIADLETSGHNYSLDVCVTGNVDDRTGIVVNIKDIDQIVKREVIQHLDGCLLNGPGGPIEGKEATGEALVDYIRRAVEPKLPNCVVLSALRLEKTSLDSFEWRSDQQDNRKAFGCLVTRVYEFSASHRLNSKYLSAVENSELFGKCNYANGHGHNYILEVTVRGSINSATGKVIDEELLDKVVNLEVVDRYDHRHLNLDIPEFMEVIPSSELLTKTIWDRLVGKIPAPTHLYRVLVRETARNIFEYYGEE